MSENESELEKLKAQLQEKEDMVTTFQERLAKAQNEALNEAFLKIRADRQVTALNNQLRSLEIQLELARKPLENPTKKHLLDTTASV